MLDTGQSNKQGGMHLRASIRPNLPFATQKSCRCIVYSLGHLQCQCSPQRCHLAPNGHHTAPRCCCGGQRRWHLLNVPCPTMGCAHLGGSLSSRHLQLHCGTREPMVCKHMTSSHWSTNPVLQEHGTHIVAHLLLLFIICYLFGGL